MNGNRGNGAIVMGEDTQKGRERKRKMETETEIETETGRDR